MRILWYQYFEFFSLLCALWCARGLKSFSITVFIPILLLDNLTEVVAVNHARFNWDTNYFIYNIYYLLSTPLYLYLFAVMLRGDRQEKRRLLGIGIAIEAFMLLDYFFIQGVMPFNTFSALLVAVMDIIFVCLILFRLTIRTDEAYFLLQDPYFWINAVLLLFSLVSLIVLGMHKYIVLYHLEFRHKNLYIAIIRAANAVLYTGYSAAFLLCQTQRSK